MRNVPLGVPLFFSEYTAQAELNTCQLNKILNSNLDSFRIVDIKHIFRN